MTTLLPQSKKPQSKKDSKARRKRSQARRSEIAKYVAKFELKVLESTPKTRAELEDAFLEHRKQHPTTTGIFAYFRHECTNYDDLLDYVFKRWGTYMDADTKDALRVRVNTLAFKYLQSINAECLTKYQPKNALKRVE